MEATSTEPKVQMDPEIKIKWLTALRSGKYQQAKEMLRNDEGFCCLGVLCDTIDPTKWTQPIEDEPCYYYLDEVTELPYNLRCKCGIMYHDAERLAIMNDNGKSFAEIADYIEKNL